MEKSEPKSKGGRKPMFDYAGEEFLANVEKLAKKGLTDREIAFVVGISPQTFCEKKAKYLELLEVLTRGRAAITAAVRAKFLAMALGGVKTKSITKRMVKTKEGEYTGETEVMSSESELAPSLQAMSVWLYHHDEEWRKVERKQDESASDIPQDIKKGIDIDSWIKDKIK
ncbi:MAG: hypothetical protein RR312_08695 [Bacteroidales bacterium]